VSGFLRGEKKEGEKKIVLGIAGIVSVSGFLNLSMSWHENEVMYGIGLSKACTTSRRERARA
jgi:hypothetical protein